VKPLLKAGETRTKEIIEAAAKFRLKQKAARLARLREVHGADEALFQALAETLGYKANRLPFILLAQRLPLKLLRNKITPTDALLFGMAGFLNETDFTKHNTPTRRYLRELWADWWKIRDKFGRLALAAKDWKLGGQRPVNHPHRRVAALARLIGKWPTLRKLAARADRRELNAFFENLHDDYWDRHYTLTSRVSKKPMALIGRTRVVEMLANVFLPLTFLDRPEVWETYRALPAALPNRRVAVAALRLFGSEAAGKPFTRTVAGQQGMLQLYSDFCTQDASDCVRCPFPERIEGWML
jgi:hypothetical protein